MKRCPYCGKEYPDEVEVCATDQTRLNVIGVAQPVSPRLKNESEQLNKGGLVFYCAGWFVLGLSIMFALESKSASPKSEAPCWYALSVLLVASLVYCIGALISKKWHSKRIRFYFGPYLLGSTGWLILFLFFWLVGRFAG